MLSELAFPHIRCCLSAIPSDLMKSTAVDESLSSMNQQFCSTENQLLQICICISMYICMHIWRQTCMHVCMNAWIHIYSLHVDIYVYRQKCMHMCRQTCMRLYVCMCTCIHIYATWNRIFYKIRQAVATTSNMVLSGLMENVITTIILLTTDGTIGCQESDTGCLMVLAPNFDIGPHT